MQFLKTFHLMESGNENIFITGKAGTGKSTLLKYFRQKTKKKIAVLASTGTAAVNIQAQTIHSFFGFRPNVTPESIRQELLNNQVKNRSIYHILDTIIIDEISMVRADLLDCVDQFLRIIKKETNKPFGGLQVIFIGDLYQLPPVVTKQEELWFYSYYHTSYFFSAKCFQELKIDLIELNQIYRQQDPKFIQLLDSIRNNSMSDIDLETINKRYCKQFRNINSDFGIYLTTTNTKANLINQQNINKLNSKEFTFKGVITGKFPEGQLPNTLELKLKIGAQVMMLNNDINKCFVNGTIGQIISIDLSLNNYVILVLLENGLNVNIFPYTWEIYSPVIEEGQLVSKVIGTFTQYPVNLAWAITIHKSQGKTFDKVILDREGGAFAHGQIYVALSRCRSLEGLILTSKISKKDIIVDKHVIKFMSHYQRVESFESIV